MTDSSFLFPFASASSAMATSARPSMPPSSALYPDFNSPSSAPAGPNVYSRTSPDVIVCPFEEAATHPSVDLVVIASPNDSHFLLQQPRSGRENMSSSTSPSLLTLLRLANSSRSHVKHSRLLSVFQNRRWESDILAAKTILESGRLGQITHFEAHQDRFRPLVRRRWREDPDPVPASGTILAPISSISLSISLVCPTPFSPALPHIAPAERPTTGRTCSSSIPRCE